MLSANIFVYLYNLYLRIARQARVIGEVLTNLDNLSKNLLYALLKFRKTATQISHDSEIRMNEIMALFIVDTHCEGNEKPLLASEVGDALSVTPSAVSQIFTSLEKKGYVSRNISECDKRQYRFALTGKGRDVTYEAQYRMEKTMGRIISRFGEARIITFTQMLNDFAELMTQIHDECKNDLSGDGV